MGYVTWANTLASYPAMLLMPLQRLYLPFFARLQADRLALQRYADRALWIANAIAAPLVVITCALAHPITVLIFGSKWLPALLLFYCLAIANAVAAGLSPMLGILNALGKSHVTLALAIGWLVVTWALDVPLMLKMGVIGLGIAIVGAQFTNIALCWAVRRELSMPLLPIFWPSWPVAILIGGLAFMLQHWVAIRSMPELAIAGFATLAVYATVLWFGFPQRSRTLKRVFFANAG
jgi:O-antigen/teichoic acid export membrane protein